MDKLSLDHAVINVRSQIDQAVDAYRRLGFVLTERGYHTLGTCNHLAVFQNDYIELLGYESETAPVQTDLSSGPIGLSALAFKSADTNALRRDLSARGVPADPPQAFSRPVALAGGIADARFEIVRLRAGANEGAALFFCHHLTPDLVWRPEWQDHPNGAMALAGIVMASADPSRSAERFARLAGPVSVRVIEGGVAVAMGDALLEVLAPDAVRRRFGAAAAAGESGRLVAVGIRTRSLETAGRALRAGGVEPFPVDDRRVVVAGQDAFGVAIEFVPLPR
jgi:hypothetical protein